MVMFLWHGDTEVSARWGDHELFRYVYRPANPQLESPRPYFHPVRTLRGDEVTIYRPHDHVWHKGIALSLPHVGPENFWGGPTFRAGRYVQLPNDGAMHHESFDPIADNGTDDHRVGRLDQRLRWVTLPTTSPVILFAVILGVIQGLQYFTQAYVAAGVASGQASQAGDVTAGTLGYPLDSTLVYPVLLFQHGFTDFQMGYASAMAMLLLAVSFAVMTVFVMMWLSV